MLHLAKLSEPTKGQRPAAFRFFHVGITKDGPTPTGRRNGAFGLDLLRMCARALIYSPDAMIFFIVVP
jgi:hypothetical protein